jgi:diguanylate cyclase (GGDEF)-like protein
LVKDDHKVFLAYNGREGIEIAKREQPNLIICDWMMPEMDGLEVCRFIKSDPELRRIPIILLTARSSVDDQVKALDAGADDFLSKPFNTAEFKARVRSILRIQELVEELETARKEWKRLSEELVRTNEKLTSLAQQDPLTELRNRRALETLLPSILKNIGDRKSDNKSYRYVTVFMIDIDDFKRINDSHGHNVGDDVLRIVTRRMSSTLRPGSMLYRYAGDEMIGVFPGVDMENARECADMLLTAVNANPIALSDDLMLQVRVSIGATVVTTSQGGQIADVIEAADKALYIAKSKGKNCAELTEYKDKEF